MPTDPKKFQGEFQRFDATTFLSDVARLLPSDRTFARSSLRGGRVRIVLRIREYPEREQNVQELLEKYPDLKPIK